MSRVQEKDGTRRLLDHLAGSLELGPAESLFATTFDLNPDFVELDFLPTVLGVSTWDDRSVKGQLELEQQLARIETVAIAMEERRYQGRPRSLRVNLTPETTLGGGVLHAKICLLVHEDAVRLLVSSANLTADGYRHNREVAMAIVATKKRGGEARLIAEALAPMRELLGPWWNESIANVVSAAQGKLELWQQREALEDEKVLWSGPGRPLWREFLALWPEGEPVSEIHIVSPFWSPEGGQGPIGQFLQGLRDHGADLSKTVVRLITGAERDKVDHFCPTLPQGFADFDFRTLGVRVEAAAAKPKVDPEDVGRDDMERERRLHAKAVLVVGPKTSLAYVGSANFTFAGWGFGNSEHSNIEAGVAMLKRGKARESLQAILPKTETAVPLNGSTTGLVLTAREAEEDEERPFPSFLHSAELRPNPGDPARLDLVVSLREGEHEAFSLELPAEDGETSIQLLAMAAGRGGESCVVELEAEILRGLLRQRAVAVLWQEDGQWLRAEYPLNVSVEARDQLPFSDPSLLPREGELIAFYQGRIEFADLFRPAEGVAAEGVGTSSAAESAVDTSQILSYQIREFVEALPGIRQELARNSTTMPSIHLAFRGPVSPVALAREIEKKVATGRSTTAVAFQLVELLTCVLEAQPAQELNERLDAAWKTAVREAAAEIRQLYEQVKASDVALAGNVSFRCYEQSLLSGHRGVL